MVKVIVSEVPDHEWYRFEILEFATIVAAKAGLVYELRSLIDVVKEKYYKDNDATYSVTNDGLYGEVYRWGDGPKYEFLGVLYTGEVRA